MPGRIIKEILIDTTVPHRCKGKPKLWRWKYTLLDHGTQWKCDECNTIWELNKGYNHYTGYFRDWIKTDTKSATRTRGTS